MNIIDLAAAYKPVISRLLSQAEGTSYSAFFLEPNPAAPADLQLLRKVYLLGILERAHLACMTFLARSRRWLDATCSHVQPPNVLGFSASLRGLLESSADAHDLMQFLPATLSNIAPYIHLVFKGSADVAHVQVGLGDLEERLIHYAYAQRQPKVGPTVAEHHLKENAKYIRALEAYAVPGARDLYSELCELTHPAAASVECFYEAGPEAIRFNSRQDAALIDALSTRYEETIAAMVQFSINPALVSLALLHRLVPEWAAPSDAEIGSIGNAATFVAELDRFIATHVDGTWKPSSLRQKT